jgi:hypothetical protein
VFGVWDGFAAAGGNVRVLRHRKERRVMRDTWGNYEPVISLGCGLEWALDWIARRAEVPLNGGATLDEWERWAEALRALHSWGPESGYAADAYRARREGAVP